MRGRIRGILIVAGLACAGLMAPRAEASFLYSLQITNPGSPTPLTASGRLELDNSGQTVTALVLRLVLFGTISNDGGTTAAEHLFVYGAGDIQSVVNLQGDDTGVQGEINFGSKAATNGAVTNGDLRLDFSSGLLGGFCFSSISAGASECFAGGGTSTGFEAGLVALPVPEPQSLGMLLASVAALIALRPRGRNRDRSGAAVA